MSSHGQIHEAREDLLSLADRLRQDARYGARTEDTKDYLYQLARDVDEIAARLDGALPEEPEAAKAEAVPQAGLPFAGDDLR